MENKGDEENQAILSPEPDVMAQTSSKVAEQYSSASKAKTSEPYRSGSKERRESLRGSTAHPGSGTGAGGRHSSVPDGSGSDTLIQKHPSLGGQSHQGTRSVTGDALPDSQHAPEGTNAAAIVFKEENQVEYIPQNKGRKGKKGRKKGPFTGWDTGRLAEHRMNHLPNYPELAPQITEEVTRFLDHRPPFKPSHRLIKESNGSGDQAKRYLEKHDVPQMFQMLLSGLLCHLPDRPLDFLIDVAREMNHQRTQVLATEELLRAGTKGASRTTPTVVTEHTAPMHFQPPPVPPPSVATDTRSVLSDRSID